MADPSYLDYEEEADLNGIGQPSQVRFPEGWAGKYVNDGMRWMGAALRRLGDRTLLAPTSGGGQQAGTMAYQNATNVDITGGQAKFYGYMPVGSVVPVYMTWTAFLATYGTTMYPFGWVLADGRTEVAPPPFNYTFTTPNLLGRYIMFFNDTNVVGTGAGFQGSFVHSTDVHQGHSHTITGTALSVAQLPPHTHTYTRTTGGGGTESSGAIGNVASVETASTGGGQTHTHSADAGGTHSHSVNVQPPTVMYIPIIRAW